jgi:hypothetical protein
MLASKMVGPHMTCNTPLLILSRLGLRHEFFLAMNNANQANVVETALPPDVRRRLCPAAKDFLEVLGFAPGA